MTADTGAGSSVAVCLVARNEAEQIGVSLDQLLPMRAAGEVDQVYVVDGGSTDGTDAVAVDRGAILLRAVGLLPSFGRVLGKGDSVWRATTAMPQDVLVFLDADIDGDLAGKVRALAAPVVAGNAALAKGWFRRTAVPPERWATGPVETSEGRITKLVARPLLAALADLVPPVPGASAAAAVQDPLGGQIAVARDVLAHVPVVTRYGLEVGMLFDVPDAVAAGVGTARRPVVEVDLGLLHHRSRPDGRLLPATRDVVATVLAKAMDRGLAVDPVVAQRVRGAVPVVRPPLDARA